MLTPRSPPWYKNARKERSAELYNKMDQWQPAQGLTGSTDLIRISASKADGESNCPEFLATKAHPQMILARAPGSRKEPRERYTAFPLGKVMQVLDRKEFEGWSIEKALAPLQKDLSLHPATRTWITHAAKTYASCLAADADSFSLRPVPEWWVVQRSKDRQIWEVYSWGRRYQSADGTTREIRLMRMGKAGQRVRPNSQIGVTAYTVAFGVPALWPEPWSEKFEAVDAYRLVNRVRVIDVGLLDGSSIKLFEGSPADAERLFRSEGGRDALRRISRGGPRQPGTGCIDCKQRTFCPSLRSAPKLLPIVPTTPQSRPLRTWSVTDGRQFNICPLQQHMRRQRLPRINEYSPEATRGKAVHAILAAAHERTHTRACESADFSSGEEELLGEPWNLLTNDARDGHRMLRQHLQVCPLQHSSSITNVRCETTLSFFDTNTNVIVIATPDMLYEEGPARIWRETKTMARYSPRRKDLLQAYPQLALGVLILSLNLLGGDPSQHRVELETLTPEYSDIEVIDVSDPEAIKVSREVIHDLIAPWYADAPVTTRPGLHCRNCPYQKWCPEHASPQASLFLGGIA